MSQIYETNTIDEYERLIGETILMFSSGCDMYEISNCIKQPVDKVIKCVEFISSIF